MRENELSFISRHADKGRWKINENELQSRLPEEEANLVMTVLKTEFPHIEETSINFDGIIRSLRLGDELYGELSDKSVLVLTDSGKERAQLTRSLVSARIAQLESIGNEKGDTKRVDSLYLSGKEITDMLADAHPDTWPPYDEMMKKEGISESEALARWVNDMNTENVNVPAEISPKEASQRYQNVIRTIRNQVTSEQIPVVLLGVGHSGSLTQLRYEKEGKEIAAEDSPEFCEMYKFDELGNLKEIKRISEP